MRGAADRRHLPQLSYERRQDASISTSLFVHDPAQSYNDRIFVTRYHHVFVLGSLMPATYLPIA